MHSITVKREMNENVEAVWKVLDDYGTVYKYNPGVETSEILGEEKTGLAPSHTKGGVTFTPSQQRTFLSPGAVITAVLLISVLVGGLAQGADWYQWWPHVSMSQIEEIIESAGVWGVGASIGLMVLHSFVPFPAELVAIANGMIYGPIWGTVITWVGAMLGAFAAFGLARMLGQRFVQWLLPEKNVQRVDDWVAGHGAGALLFSRFIPVIAFNLINYAAGLTKISWWRFAWTTGLGILPLTTLMVVMGDQIETLPWQAWLLLLGAGLALWLATYRLLPAVAPGRPPLGNQTRELSRRSPFI